MDFDRFELRVEGGKEPGRLKLIWAARGSADPWYPPPYEISRGTLQQSSDMVRDVLRRLAILPDPIDEAHYREILRNLMIRSFEFCDTLFEPVDGNMAVALEARELVRSASREPEMATMASLDIILCDETVHVPWGFAYNGEMPDPPADVRCSIDDLSDFWLRCFRLTVHFQGGSSRLPKPGEERRRLALYALHEELFAKARTEMRRSCVELDEKLDQLLTTDSVSATTWTECRRHWQAIAEDYDSVLYMFGHADGERILLADDCDTPDAVLPASGFSSSFRKRGDTRSASICILNGCRTAAPGSNRPWPASFLSATRRPGFFGFIGTEIELPNTIASRYGVALLWRLFREGEALGDAFDALRREPDLFPANLLYTCFANRQFRLPIADRAIQ